MSFQISKEEAEKENNEVFQPKTIENLFNFSPTINSTGPPNFPSITSTTVPPPSPAITSILPPESPALTSLNQNSSASLFKEMRMIPLSTNSNIVISSPPVNTLNSKNCESTDSNFRSFKPTTHLNQNSGSFVLTPPFSPSRNQEDIEPTSDNFACFQLDDGKQLSPIIENRMTHSTTINSSSASMEERFENESELEEEEKKKKKKDQLFLIKTTNIKKKRKKNIHKQFDEDAEYKPPPDGMEEEEMEEEEKFVEKMVEEELEIQRRDGRGGIDSKKKSTHSPSENIMEKEDENTKFSFHEDEESLFVEDPGGIEFNQFMTSKEAYRKENPTHRVLVAQSANNHNPWTIHNKMKEEVERQRHLIENLRIRQIQEEELAFARAAQSAKNNLMMEEELENEDEEMEDVEKSNSGKNVIDNNDDEKNFAESEIDYSQWTIGTRADVVLDGSPTPKKEPYATQMNLNIYAFDKEFVEKEEEKGQKNVKKYNKIKQKKKKQSQKKKKKQGSKKKIDKKLKKKTSSMNTKIKKTIDVDKPGKRKRKIQVRKVQDYMGVYTRGNGRFFCTARLNGKQKYLGSFASPNEAALEYDKFVFAHRGADYASYNFPELLGLDQDKSYKK